MRPRVVPPPWGGFAPGNVTPGIPTAPTPNKVMSFKIFWRPNSESSRPARIWPHVPPNVRYTWRISMAAPDCTSNWSWTPAFWICGAKPKCTERFIPASLPRASNVANVGSSPVRTLEFVGPVLFCFVTTQKAFTLPAKENDHPFDICIVSWALAAAGQSSATATNNSARRFIRESLLRECTCSIKPLVPCEALIDVLQRQVQPSGNMVLPPVRLVELRLIG